MRRKPDLEFGVWSLEFGGVRMAGVKKILLAQVAEFRAGFARDVRMVVDDQADVRAPRNG